MSGINFKGFKKVSEDAHSATLLHPQGHKLTIAKKALSPKMRSDLAELKLADGGAVPDVDPNNAKKFVKGFTTPDTDFGSMIDNVKKAFSSPTPEPQNNAKGGQIHANYADGTPNAPVAADDPITQNSSQMPPAATDEGAKIIADAADQDPTAGQNITGPRLSEAEKDHLQYPKTDTQTPVAAPTGSDPALQAKRELYNLNVGTMAGSTADPSAGDTAMTMMFGKDGSAPENFNPDAWKQAEQQFAVQQQEGAAKQQSEQAQVVDANKQRAAAGLPQMPVPAAAQPAMGPQTTGNDQGASSAVAQGQPGSPADIFGNEAASRATIQGLGLQQQGIQGVANAKSAEAAMNTQTLQKSIADKAKIAQDYQQHNTDLWKEYNNSRQALQDQKIDFNRYWNDKSTGSKIMSTLGVIISGFGADTNGNGALRHLQGQIERDVETQKAQLGQKENLLTATMKQFGNLKDGTQMAIALQQGALADQLQLAATKTGGSLAQAQAKQASGALLASAAQNLGQIAMRRTMMTGAQSGHVDPSLMLRAYGAPESTYKQLQEAQDAVKAKDNALSGFDQLSKINTFGNYATSPWQNPSQVKGIRENLIATLSKATAGRFTEQDSKMLDSVMPYKTDNQDSLNIKRERLNRLLSEKMNYPELKQYGITPDTLGGSSYNSQGQNKFQLQPVVGKK